MGEPTKESKPQRLLRLFNATRSAKTTAERDTYFAQLIDALTPVVNAAIAKYHVPDADRDDLLQMLYLLIFTEMSGYDESKSAVTTWVRIICERRLITAFKHARTKRKKFQTGDHAALETTDDDGNSMPFNCLAVNDSPENDGAAARLIEHVRSLKKPPLRPGAKRKQSGKFTDALLSPSEQIIFEAAVVSADGAAKLNYKSIAATYKEQTGKRIGYKAIDNTLSRLRRKLRELMGDEGEDYDGGE